MTDQLKIAVERIVRPVQAPVSRKLLMRRELFEHLSAIYAEESAAKGDEAAALRRSLSRFGDTAALTDELQRTVPAIERYEAWLNDSIGPRPGDTPFHVAGRMALMMLVVMAAALGTVMLVKTNLGYGRAIPLLAAATLTALISIDTLLIGWTAITTSAAVLPPAPSAFRLPRVWLGAAASAGIVVATGLGAMAVVSRGLPISPIAVRHWLVLAAAAVGIFVVVMRLFQSERRRAHEWESLELTAAE